MPIFNDDTMENQTTTNGFGFSAKRIDHLQASEYTLVGIACDKSGSVGGFQNDLVSCIKEVTEACRKSPRADNLMLRLVAFNQSLEEVHGFRPLTECAPDNYNGCIQPSGSTALYDATVSVLGSVISYGESLWKQDYVCNGIVFVLTDGDDNVSKMTADEIKKVVTQARQAESLESLLVILVGVNVQNPDIARYLADLKAKGGFDQYVELKDASQKTLAKLAKFVSQSISSQSQALGTGGPSATIAI